MGRFYSAADVERLASEDGVQELFVRPGEIISPQALDVARARGLEVVWADRPQTGGERGAPSHADGEGDDSCECHSPVIKALTSSLRSVIDEVAAEHPGEPLEAVVSATLERLGARETPALPGLVTQANPVGDRRLPVKARGARPVFFENESMDHLVSIVMSLASEVWVLYERIDTLERMLANERLVDREALQAYRPEGQVVTDREAEAASFMRRVLRIFQEMREEVTRDDTWDKYTHTVSRAYAQIHGGGTDEQ
jgi:hypothetical protein